MGNTSSPKYVVFDKNMTSIVKGFAILFMFMLHCYDDYKYDVELDYSNALMFAHGGYNVCVGMYAFMIGFGYSFAKKKDWHYSLQHIKKVVLPYWSIFFFFMLPCCYQAFFSSGIRTIFFTFIGFDTTYHYYNWFIYLFVVSMLVMPSFSRFIDKKPIRNSAIIIFIIYALEVVTHPFLPHLEDNNVICFFLNCFQVTPVVILGYLFAHERYYERIRVDKLPAPLVMVGSILTIIVVLILCHNLRVRFGFLFDFFYAPIVIGAIVVFFNKFNIRPFRAVMAKLGWASMYMWFLHASFHTPTIRWFYQPIITIFSNVNIVVLWTFIVVFCWAWIVRSVIDRVMGTSK